MKIKKTINDIRRSLVNNDLIKGNGTKYSEKTIYCYNVILKGLLEIMGDFEIDTVSRKEVDSWVSLIRITLRDNGNESVTENTYISCLKWAINKASDLYDINVPLKGSAWSKLPDTHQMIVPEYSRVIRMVRSFAPNSDIQRKSFEYIKTAAFTGARYSDMKSWTRERNIMNNHLVYIPKKTGGKLIKIPLSPLFNFGQINLLPRIPYTTLLKEVKTIFKLSGFTRDVIREREVGSEKVFVKNQEWELMGLHRLRASAITGMLQNGMTETEVKSFSGHSMDSKSFKRYVDLDNSHLETKYNNFISNING